MSKNSIEVNYRHGKPIRYELLVATKAISGTKERGLYGFLASVPVWKLVLAIIAILAVALTLGVEIR